MLELEHAPKACLLVGRVRSVVECGLIESWGPFEARLKRHSVAVAAAQRESELLLCCARTRMDQGHAERIHRLIAEGIQWDRVFDAAFVHGVLPLVYWQLKTIAPGEVPRAWMKKLHEGFLQNTRRNILLAGELLNVLGLFRAGGIPAFPFKGPVLAEQAYGNIAFRQFVDLDLLLGQGDMVQAQGLLAEHGYCMDEETAGAVRFGEVPGQYVFFREQGCAALELHSEATLRYFPRKLNLDELAQRVRPALLMDSEVLALSAEDAVILLSVHGSKHLWCRLAWVCDLAELAQAEPWMDWEFALRRARAFGVERMLLLGLHLANSLLETALPEVVKKQIMATPIICKLGEQVRASCLVDSGRECGIVGRAQFRIRLHRDSWTGIRHVVRLATSPSQEDWSSAKLPAGLRPFYAALRPLRLLRRYGLRSSQKAAT